MNENEIIVRSAYEIRSGHRRRICDVTCDGCMICNGGLFHCTICNGAEGSLLPKCPGRKLSQAEDDIVYQHYMNGTGPFMSRREKFDTAAITLTIIGLLGLFWWLAGYVVYHEVLPWLT